MKTLKMTASVGQTLFVLNGMEYYLVEFKTNPGVESYTHRDALECLQASGHIPAIVREREVFDHVKIRKHKGWITLFDCRENMNDLVGYSVGATDMPDLSGGDGLVFYHLDHGGGNNHHPALCWKK